VFIVAIGVLLLEGQPVGPCTYDRRVGAGLAHAENQEVTVAILTSGQALTRKLSKERTTHSIYTSRPHIRGYTLSLVRLICSRLALSTKRLTHEAGMRASLI